MGQKLETIGRDLRYGVRMLLKSPGVTTLAVLALALGIGANTAIWQESHVIIVNEAFAQHFFLNEDPIGKRIKVGFGDPPWSTIVGVVANHIQPGVDNLVWEEMFYPAIDEDVVVWRERDGSGDVRCDCASTDSGGAHSVLLTCAKSDKG